MDAPTFIQKWSKANLSEQAASQEHFLDLCRLLGVKTPAELDPVGDTFTFEKGAKVSAPASLGSKGDRGRAVLNTYAATDPDAGWTPAWAEVFEPTGAGQPLPEAHPLTQLRAETEQSILARLLAVNANRSGGI